MGGEERAAHEHLWNNGWCQGWTGACGMGWATWAAEQLRALRAERDRLVNENARLVDGRDADTVAINAANEELAVAYTENDRVRAERDRLGVVVEAAKRYARWRYGYTHEEQEAWQLLEDALAALRAPGGE